jgi:pSer/pThr/pTyr-binding forkhead associated (FHA) protein
LYKKGNFYVQDLNSLNGTFLNGIRITQAPLTHGDVITVGKHTIRFSIDRPGEKSAEALQPPAHGSVPKLEGTMMLDTRTRRETQEKIATKQGMAATSPAPAALVGRLSVVKGRTTEKEYLLTSQTSMVGKLEGSAVRLKGWFAPKLAAIINKHGETYHLSPASKKVLVNGQLLTARQELKEGDLVAVGKVEMKFTLVAW